MSGLLLLSLAASAIVSVHAASCGLCVGDGACAKCTACKFNRYGPCEPCWADNNGFACLPFCEDECNWEPDPGPAPAPTSSGGGGMPTCDICVGSGQCKDCSACKSMQTGQCAPCWADNNGFACLPFCETTCNWEPTAPTSPTTPAPAPAPGPAPVKPTCDICVGGGQCSACTACEGMKTGSCAPCWADNDGFSCLPYCKDTCNWQPAADTAPTPANPACELCNNPDPDIGQCKPCIPCVTMQDGPCADCWADHSGTSCLPFCDETCWSGGGGGGGEISFPYNDEVVLEVPAAKSTMLRCKIDNVFDAAIRTCINADADLNTVNRDLACRSGDLLQAMRFRLNLGSTNEEALKEFSKAAKGITSTLLLACMIKEDPSIECYTEAGGFCNVRQNETDESQLQCGDMQGCADTNRTSLCQRCKTLCESKCWGTTAACTKNDPSWKTCDALIGYLDNEPNDWPLMLLFIGIGGIAIVAAHVASTVREPTSRASFKEFHMDDDMESSSAYALSAPVTMGSINTSAPIAAVVSSSAAATYSSSTEAASTPPPSYVAPVSTGPSQLNLDGFDPSKAGQYSSLLQEGAQLNKHGRAGNPHMREVFMAGNHIFYTKVNQRKTMKQSESVFLIRLEGVVKGKTTDVLKRTTAKAAKDECCFTLLGAERQLNLECESEAQRDMWVEALKFARDRAIQASKAMGK